MVATALELDAEPELSDLHLARHAHRLGFGGHFLTKSRGYSTTFAALRDARVQWNEGLTPRRPGSPSPGHRGPLAGDRCRLRQPGREPLRLPSAASAGRRPEGGALRLVHPKRVSPCPEAKTPQAVRQRFAVPRFDVAVPGKGFSSKAPDGRWTSNLNVATCSDRSPA
jgi:hypothetical protein